MRQVLTDAARSDTKLEIGSVFRYARPYRSTPSAIDGLPNYFAATALEKAPFALLESGINTIAEIGASDGTRTPAILISSSPHKTGRLETPWHDTFDPDRGVIRYYGDNKRPECAPELARGNAALLAQYRVHTSPDFATRSRAAPLIFFRRVTIEGRVKGNVMFQGYGIVTGAALVTQMHPTSRRPFANYVFEFAVLSLASEGESFRWGWINSRRDTKCTLEATMRLAPASWQNWIRGGPDVVERNRRRVQKLTIISEHDQAPAPGSAEAAVVRTVYEFYRGRKHRFENLASVVAQSLLKQSGADYREGWLSPPTADGGWDFIGKIDVGVGAIATKLICLGQAKCEKPDMPTNGNSIARLVARLQRGWLGIYVTTSFFSAPVQREVQVDKYPVVLIHGRALAEQVLFLMNQSGETDVLTFLEAIDSTYGTKVRRRRPEDILVD